MDQNKLTNIQPIKTQMSLEEAANALNLLLDYPPAEYYRDAQILMVRHGFSEFNFNIGQYYKGQDDKSIHTSECKDYRLNISDIDSPLHAIGVEQARNSQKYLNELDIHTVFVSPLYRTLQTADILFETYPLRDQIQFIVLPQLAEGLCYSSSFAPLAFDEVRQKQFSDFDFSYGNNFKQKSIWQIEQHTCQNTKSVLQEKLKDIEDEKILSQVYLDELDKQYPSHIENHQDLWNRSQQARKIIEEHKKNIPQDKKIVIVSHYLLSLFLTSSQRLENIHDMDGVRCKNSKLIPWNI